MKKDDLLSNTKNALTFIDAMFHEIALLIKEVQAELKKHGFIIGKPSGYGVTTRSSSGIEAQYVSQWLSRSFTVFFVRPEDTHEKEGTTTTKESPDLKLLLLHIGLPDENTERPRVVAAFLDDIQFKQTRYKKFENYMTRFAYVPHRIFKEPGPFSYSDSYFSISGNYVEEELFAMTDSRAIVEKIVEPMLAMWQREQPS